MATFAPEKVDVQKAQALAEAFTHVWVEDPAIEKNSHFDLCHNLTRIIQGQITTGTVHQTDMKVYCLNLTLLMSSRTDDSQGNRKYHYQVIARAMEFLLSLVSLELLERELYQEWSAYKIWSDILRDRAKKQNITHVDIFIFADVSRKLSVHF